MECQPIPGTMKVHAVVPVTKSEILVRPTSCYCDDCIKGIRCDGWVKRAIKLRTETAPDTEVGLISDAPTVAEVQIEDNKTKLDVGEFVAAKCADKWYLGRVLEVDEEDQDAKITFMVSVKSKQGTTYKWPRPDDELWIPFQDILTKVESPTPVGRSERFFEITAETLNLIEDLSQAACSNK
ncbi:hypothetical protein HOLleu_11115 [Holothuria leucospilota]|uniref:Uncharacterized protein n=1 Tax=Holothuria leucospilota TaxID=206669 RepID=A0A9Q1CF89_HOLLE|nr:hypothetical protein HOLleu_11115 [Holothuria leucospilota]